MKKVFIVQDQNQMSVEIFSTLKRAFAYAYQTYGRNPSKDKDYDFYTVHKGDDVECNGIDEICCTIWEQTVNR